MRTGARNAKWRGGTWINKYGYVVREFPDGSRKLEHRYVMEQHLGYELSPDVHVHHKDENKLRNAIENLVILTPTEHQHLHRQGKTIGRWSRKHDYCTACGSTKEKHMGGGLCAKCYFSKRYDESQLKKTSPVAFT